MLTPLSYQNNGHYNEYIILNKLWLKVFGFNEGYLLSVLHNWLLNKEKAGMDIYEGKPWVRCSYQQWEEYLPFKKSMLNTVLAKLKAMNVILETDRLNYDRRDRTKWYTINYEAVKYFEEAYKQNLNLVTVVVEKEKGRAPSEKCIFQKSDNAYSENRNMQIPKNGDCIVQNSDNAYSKNQKSENGISLDTTEMQSNVDIKYKEIKSNKESVCGCNNVPAENTHNSKNGNILEQVLSTLNRTLIMLSALIEETQDNRNVGQLSSTAQNNDQTSIHNEKSITESVILSEKQREVIQILKEYAVSDEIIHKLLLQYDTEQKLQDLIEFLKDDYFTKFVLNASGFLKYAVENNYILKKKPKNNENRAKEYTTPYQKKRCAKSLREERPPETYTQLEELYKKALRRDIMEEQPNNDDSILARILENAEK